jgi:hypothetical protein
MPGKEDFGFRFQTTELQCPVSRLDRLRFMTIVRHRYLVPVRFEQRLVNEKNLRHFQISSARDFGYSVFTERK